jgi:hypothetical protein
MKFWMEIDHEHTYKFYVKLFFVNIYRHGDVVNLSSYI